MACSAASSAWRVNRPGDRPIAAAVDWARRVSASPVATARASQRPRSWSASSTTSPFASRRPGARAAVSSTSPRRPATSGSSGSRSARSRASSRAQASSASPGPGPRSWAAVTTNETTVSTASSRPGSSAVGGTRKGMAAAAILCLARVMRAAVAASPDSSTRATNRVGKPHTSRRVNATRDAGASAGCAHVHTNASRSAGGRSPAAPTVSPASVSVSDSVGLAGTSSGSRRRRRSSRRTASTARRCATVVSQAAGESGTPLVGQFRRAASNAACVQSSASCRSPVRRMTVASTRDHDARATCSTAARPAGPAGPTTPHRSPPFH